jgi:hypothetical protein
MTPWSATVGLRIVCGFLAAACNSAATRAIAGTADSPDAIARIAALPSPDRVSLLIEFTGPVANVSSTTGTGGTSATIEAGPIAGVTDVTERELVSSPDLNVIARVSVRTYRKSPDTFIRILVRLKTACRQKLRVAGRRVYLDLVPLQTPAAAAVPGRSNQPPEETTEATYHALEADAVARARSLAARPDVKALQALRDEVLRRDAQLGRKRPEIVSRLLDEIDRRTDEARSTRLKLDGQLFRKPRDLIH